jgi:hypothetical protein
MVEIPVPSGYVPVAEWEYRTFRALVLRLKEKVYRKIKVKT